jgi:hypothetical protein
LKTLGWSGIVGAAATKLSGCFVYTDLAYADIYGDYADLVYSDYPDYGDYSDYGDYGPYGDYFDYGDYSDYFDYADLYGDFYTDSTIIVYSDSTTFYTDLTTIYTDLTVYGDYYDRG